MIHISAHAVERYLERVDGRLSYEQARAAIETHAPAVEKAAAFGCRIVKLGCGARLLLDGTSVVTVLSPGRHRVHHDGSGLPWDRNAVVSVDEMAARPVPRLGGR